MIQLLTIGIFILLIGIAILICLFLKVNEQHKIKKQRISLLSENSLCNNDTYIYQSLYEIYTNSYSHYLTYCVGHFANILLDTYSIIFSISALSMVTINGEDNITQIISLLSTFFVVTLVFSRLDERSMQHHKLWRKYESAITKISQSISNCTDDNMKITEIYALITFCRGEI